MLIAQDDKEKLEKKAKQKVTIGDQLTGDFAKLVNSGKFKTKLDLKLAQEIQPIEGIDDQDGPQDDAQVSDKKPKSLEKEAE